ncbi:DNA-binding response regulator, NarL/FixJ family, contains REC and HTH domains [Kibdelosporangium aridum]|uniref:DNA-binding response regulator, NarL/FixJ family, contains REC and HTH domains n=1 Tax=Kibdelosporangium aridum TaxID=2030 RepID=A0A1W2FGP0_KIBAR|nr:DNA-binding response regulator, NarL/FixJ family, contains REC and HTH domains [Kibdelosporangium aridum]
MSECRHTVVLRCVDGLLRDALANWIASLPGYLVAGAAATGDGLLRLCTLRSPDTAVVELRSAAPEELEFVGELRAVRCEPHIVGLHRALDARSLAFLHHAGVHRLVSTRFGVAGLRDALAEADEGWRPVVPGHGLSARELEILALICAGCSAAEIAGELGISPHTVTNHKRRIFAKLDVQSRTQATAEVGRLGMRLPGQQTRRPNGEAPRNLTKRERDILDSIARGESVRQTAQALGIAIKTVQSEQRQLFSKLSARNRPQALTNARGYGLVDSN